MLEVVDAHVANDGDLIRIGNSADEHDTALDVEEEIDDDGDEQNIDLIETTVTHHDNDVNDSSRLPMTPICFKYHIVYSESFQVPVLYFSAWNMDTSQYLTREQIMTIIIDKHRDDCILPKELNPYTMITQGEHPILSTIFYYVHPCETSKLMDLVWCSDDDLDREHNQQTIPLDQYVRSWLSFVGRLVLINVPPPSRTAMHSQLVTLRNES